ncbi:MAG: GNAT family N-acetyltransferase [Gammaproteobacteria bacterium]|nr:GNAT family N-acetyltransferase [Gammaproteobacteria bacterium]MDH5652466.1 GNAT family N-acetyltransferase [Gammaproteobacteria bacterium]
MEKMDIINTIKSYAELPPLFKATGLGNRSDAEIEAAFKNSRYIAAIYREDKLIGAGRAFGDEVDCAVICDLVVLPEEQTKGLGSLLLNNLVAQVSHHLRVILYAVPGKEGFYKKHNFHTMKTARMTSAKLPLEWGRNIGFIE